MEWQAWFTLGVIGLVFVMMVRGVGPPDILLLGGTVLVGLAGVITPDEVVAGFANKSMLTIGALFVVAAGMRETGALDRVGRRMLGAARTRIGALLRIGPQVAGLSMFLNNTTVIAMVIPIIGDWCRKNRVSPSQLLIPLAYLSFLGGMITLIGTSRNLIVSELMDEAALLDEANASLSGGLSLFELAWLGVPSLVVGMIYLLLAGKRLLPDRKDLLERLGDTAREYVVNVRIEENCPHVGKRIDEAGLRRLPGLFLIDVVRDGRLITPVGPDEVLQAGDLLTFTGVVSTIVELERTPGIVPAGDDNYQTAVEQKRVRRYCEAVISRSSPLIGQTIRDANFRARYNAAIVAVHRGRARLQGRIGDFVVRPGDTLLMQTGPHFSEAHRNNPDFLLVSPVSEARPVRHEHAGLAMGLLAVLIVLMVAPQVPVVLAAFTVGGLMIGLRCISTSDARRAVQWDVLLVIAAAFGLGKALDNSGAAATIANLLVQTTNQWGPYATLAAIYIITVIFGILVTSNATAVLVFPIAIAAAHELHVDPRPFAITVAASASMSFASPVAYQGNMLVYGPGGYRYADFLRIGLPLNLLLGALALAVIPWVWPLHPNGG